MKRIGMIGGFGPEATLDYYKLLMEIYRKEIKDGSIPEIIIYSMDISILLNLVEKKQWDILVKWLVNGLEVLHQAGSNFGFISANTPHIVFDRVNELSPIPLLSIVEETCKHIDKLALRRVGLLGTKFTMQSDFYKKVCDKYKVVIFVPNEKEQDYIHSKLMIEIEFGIFLDEKREGLRNIVKRMIAEDLIEG